MKFILAFGFKLAEMRKGLLILTIFLLIVSCKTSKKYSEVKSVDTKFIMPDLFSTLNVHYKLNNESINDTFNKIVDYYLNNEMELTALGMDVVLNKHDDAQMHLNGRSVLTNLPVSIALTKSTFLKDLKANGTLELSFITDIDVDSTWQLVTSTRLEVYNWIEEPKLSIGGINLSIGKLANSIIDKSKDEFQKQIDQAVKDQFSLRTMVLDMMKYVEEPIHMDTLINSWLTLEPEKIHMSDIIQEQNFSVGNITVQGRSKVHDRKPEKLAGLKLPHFNWEKDLDDTSHVNLVMDISYEQLDGLIQSEFVGRTFDNAGKSVTIESAKLKKEGKRLAVDAKVSGSVNGDIIVSAEPVFDNERQAFTPQNIDVRLKTKNILHKAGAWLMKGKIKNQLGEMMYFSIKDNIKQVQNQIDEQLSSYNQDKRLELSIDLRNVTVNKFVLDNERLHTFITLNAFLQVQVNDMSIFQDGSIRRPLRG